MLKANEAIEVHVQGSSSGCVAEGWGDANMFLALAWCFLDCRCFCQGLGLEGLCLLSMRLRRFRVTSPGKDACVAES